MSDSFIKVIESLNNKKENKESVLSVPCVVTEKLDNEMVKVRLVSNNATYTVPNRSGNDVTIGENVSLFYNGIIITESQAYIGAVLNKRSDKYYTKPETDNMLNGMSIEKMSKAEYDSLPVKNPNRVYFVYNPDNSYDIYIGTIKINGEGGGYENLPVHIKAKIQEYLDSESVVVNFSDGTLSDTIEFAVTSPSQTYGSGTLTIKPREKCILLAFVVYYFADQDEVFKRFQEAGFQELDRYYVYEYTTKIDPVCRYGVVVLSKQSNGSTTTLRGSDTAQPPYRCSNISFAALYNAESVTVTHCGNANTYSSYSYSYYTEGEAKPYHIWKGFKVEMASKPCLYFYEQQYAGVSKGVYTSGGIGLNEYNFDVETQAAALAYGGRLNYNGQKTGGSDLLWMYYEYADTTSQGVERDAEGYPYPHGVGLITVEINERSETE